MNIAFVLHLYQPSTQLDTEFKSISMQCYAPLLKLIKSKSDCRFTLNVPLSTLEQFENIHLNDLIFTIKDLLEADKIELTGSAAYHSLLTKLPEELATREVILNEYALGYYFGYKQGFEGEPSIMVKDVKGFFSPELAINESVVKLLNSLSYSWTLVDLVGMPETVQQDALNKVVYKLKDAETSLVVRDTTLSNMLSFKRDSNIDDVVDYIIRKSNDIDTIVVALDAETFGHHNREGIYMLDTLIDRLVSLGVKITTVSEAIDGFNPEKISSLPESTWAMVDSNSPVYPFWEDSSNETHDLLWQLLKGISSEFLKINLPKAETGFETLPVWKSFELSKLTDDILKQYLSLELLVLKAMQSDQFWWSSHKDVADTKLYSPFMIRAALDLYNKISETSYMKHSKDIILKLSSDVKKQIEA